MVKKVIPLTAREKNVLRLVAKARTNREIAVALGISAFTVKRHMERILRKLKLRNRVQAALYAVETGARKAQGKGDFKNGDIYQK